MSKEKPEKRDLQKFARELISSTSGSAAVALVAKGPEAALLALIGAPLSRAISSVVGDVLERHLSSREKVRLSQCLGYGIQKMLEHAKDGHVLRDDDLLNGRKVEEVLEAVIQKAREEPQEKKLRHIGYIFANAAYTNASANTLHAVIQAAEQMSYRQLSIIALLYRSKERGFDLKRFSESRLIKSAPKDDQEAAVINQECIRLAEAMALISYDHGADRLTLRADAVLSATSGGLTPVGRLCYELCSLEEIPDEELEKLERAFPLPT